MGIEGKTTGKDIKKAVTFGSNRFIISGATSTTMLYFIYSLKEKNNLQHIDYQIKFYFTICREIK